jgi:CheY-like chemotaxis protein
MQGSKVLVVDGEPQILGLLKAALEPHGLCVLTALTSEEAIRIVEAQPTQIAVVLADVQMPGISGPMLVREVVQRAPTIAVALMSAGAEGESIDPGIPVFSKPFSLRILIETIEELLARQKMWTAQTLLGSAIPLQRRW